MSTIPPPFPSFDDWLSTPPPPGVLEARDAYLADLDELLAHVGTAPAEVWVAYRGGRRLGFGASESALRRECLTAHPDGQFSVFGIDPSARQHAPA